MAEVRHRLEIVVDPNRPTEEIQNCILAIASVHPGKQLDILQDVGKWLGGTISEMKEDELKKKNELKNSKVK